MMRIRILPLIAFIFIIFSLSTTNTFADDPVPQPPVPANVIFPPPNMTNINNATDLASYLVQAFSLPTPDYNLTIVNPIEHGLCCLYNWENRSIPINQSRVEIITHDLHSFSLHYWHSGKFAMARIHGSFGDAMPEMTIQAMFERVDMIAQRIGISSIPHNKTTWNKEDYAWINGTNVQVSATVVILYSDYSGFPLAFGNELRIIFDSDHGRMFDIRLYPWFSAPTPVLTSSQALHNALDFLNRTDTPYYSDLTESKIYFAFDSIRYSLIYQVETRKASSSLSYRLWVDPYDGNITYWAIVSPHPGLDQGPMISFPLEYLILTILFSCIVALALVFEYKEPAKMAMLSLILMPYSKIHKEGPLDHFVRGQLYAYIALNPGVTYSSIRDAFSLKNGTATYHLIILKSFGYIKSINDGKYKRFFPIQFDEGKLGHKLTKFQNRILCAIRQLESAGPSEIARAVSATRQRSAYNLRKMLEFGLIAKDPQNPRKFKILDNTFSADDPDTVLHKKIKENL
ncbi:MAG: hypothetical protein ACFFC7_28855 [Candidatus Hermodarchaeota archaeon]